VTGLQVPSVRPAPPSVAVRARDLLACEWTKLRSVRSTYWTLLIAMLTPIAVSALLAFAFTVSRGQGAAVHDPMLPGFVSLEYAVLAVGTLGVLVFTAEYSSGLAATTFAAAPRRWAVLAAKAAVTGVVTLIAGEAASFTSFFVVQAILARKHLGVSLAHPGAAGAAAAEGALLMVCALLGVGVGAMIRHTAGAVATLVGLIFLPAILGVLPPPWNDRIDRFMVFYAAHQVVTLHPDPGLLSPGLSLIVVLAWPAAALAGATVVLTRRDV
jgi:ABC-2 type transport system permease protein